MATSDDVLACGSSDQILAVLRDMAESGPGWVGRLKEAVIPLSEERRLFVMEHIRVDTSTNRVRFAKPLL